MQESPLSLFFFFVLPIILFGGTVLIFVKSLWSLSMYTLFKRVWFFKCSLHTHIPYYVVRFWPYIVSMYCLSLLYCLKNLKKKLFVLCSTRKECVSYSKENTVVLFVFFIWINCVYRYDYMTSQQQQKKFTHWASFGYIQISWKWPLDRYQQNKCARRPGVPVGQ